MDTVTTGRTHTINTTLLANNDKAESRQASKETTPFADTETPSLEKMLNTLEQILDVLQGSTIAEERGKDVPSKFWAMYKKVSNEYDQDFLDRANNDMNIILTFAGLFSAVNSTFIIGMQPNPGDTTNVLMVQLINIIANSTDAVKDMNNLSSSTTYSSSTVWMPTLAYASLSFSLLAAFGAVMGKQWLDSYKAAPGRGTLEERGLQRQRKLGGVEQWQLQTVLGSFLVLLQISLLLFGLSLSANMWTQKITISSIIICTTAFGMIFFLSTIAISARYPDSPFQTAGSALAQAIYRKCRSFESALIPDIRLSAIRWMLETSTNPEVVAAAAAITPLVQWSSKVDVSASYKRLYDNLMSCGDRSVYLKAMAHFWTQSSVKIDRALIWLPISSGSRNDLIRNAFTAGRDAWKQFMNAEGEIAKRKYKADVRTALRTMVVHGRSYRLSLPDDEDLIWDGDLRWCHSDGHLSSSLEFDWLVDYLENVDNIDNETEGDALLALSAVHSLGSPIKEGSIRVLIRCSQAKSPRVRYAALRATVEARDKLASITRNSMPQGVDAELLNDLCGSILNAVPNQTQTNPDGGPSAPFHERRDLHYLRLIFSLAANDEWRQRLSCHGHVERCASLVNPILECPLLDLNFYLAGILLRIDPSGADPSLKDLNPGQERWRTLMSKAWMGLRNIRVQEIYGYIDVLPALVEATRQNFEHPDNGLSSWRSCNVQFLVESVQQVLAHLGAIVGQGDESLLSTALSAVQGLYDDLCRMDTKGGV